MTPLVVGQKLLLVTDKDRWRGSLEEEVEILSIGRRWVRITSHWGRIDKNTLAIDGGRYGSPGRCYFSREHHAAEIKADRRWSALRHQIYIGAKRDGITADTIERAATLLGITLPEDTE